VLARQIWNAADSACSISNREQKCRTGRRWCLKCGVNAWFEDWYCTACADCTADSCSFLKSDRPVRAVCRQTDTHIPTHPDTDSQTWSLCPIHFPRQAAPPPAGKVWAQSILTQHRGDGARGQAIREGADSLQQVPLLHCTLNTCNRKDTRLNRHTHTHTYTYALHTRAHTHTHTHTHTQVVYI